MADLDELAATFALMARPYVLVENSGSEIVLRIVSPVDSTRALLTFGMRPAVEDWLAQRPEIVRSFDEFNDLVAVTVDRATALDEPLDLMQQIYNRGIMLNSHNWIDAFNFKTLAVDSDIEHWAHRSY
jgi:hypothetical protein